MARTKSVFSVASEPQSIAIPEQSLQPSESAQLVVMQRTRWPNSADSELAHHAAVLVLEDVAVEHERRLAAGRLVEAGDQLHLITDEDRILPAAVLRPRRPEATP